MEEESASPGECWERHDCYCCESVSFETETFRPAGKERLQLTRFFRLLPPQNVIKAEGLSQKNSQAAKKNLKREKP